MYNHFLDVGLQAVEAAKTITLGYFGKSAEELGTMTKDDARFEQAHQMSPVTRADQEAEQAIKAVIRAHFPDHGFCGEEEGEEQGSSGYTWIIDPIDGTRNFARGLPYWGILLALEQQGELVVAIVCVPMMHELIRATTGGGCWRNGKQVQVSHHTLPEAYLFHNRHTYFQKKGLFDHFTRLCHEVAYTKSCISREMVYVATGGCDVAINLGGNYYDNAPLALLVTEAGGRVTTLTGGEFSRADTSMIVSNGIVHDEVVRLLNA